MTDMRTDEVALPVDPSQLPSCAPDNPLEALSWLGETVEEVAEGLRARGIKGRRGSPWNCPLANYLKGWWPHATVSMGKADTKWILTKNNIHTYLPPACTEFEERFDHFHFPDLIEP